VYDSHYVALAVQEGAVCITADRRLYDRILGTPLSARVAWIEEA